MASSQRDKCFFAEMREAIALRKTFRRYVREKESALAGSGNVGDNCSCTKTLGSLDTTYPRKQTGSSKKNSLFENFLIEDSIQNYILKSVLGFIGGILLTYICFMFLVFSLNFTLKRATYICMGLGIVLSLGLAFSIKIRCTVFLCIPQMFSKRGRQALLAYAFILALSGPAKNTLHNVEVMSESLACGQEQIKQAENELLKCVQRPNAAAKKSIEKLLIKLNGAVKYFRNFVLQFYRNCFDVLETLFHSQKWLYSISSLCNEKMGDPTERCQNLLIESSENCQAATDLLYWKRLCQLHPFAVELMCTTYEDEFCCAKDVHPYPPTEFLKKQLDTFKRRAMNVLYVRVDVHQTYTQSNHSRTFHEEYQGMATEIRQKTDQVLQYFDFMSVIFGIFILVLFVKVIIYRHKFLTEDHYDNRFITPDFEDIDNTRAEFKMETILPLKPRERIKYIKVTSIRLVPCEKIRLLSSFIFLIFATFKIIIHMLTDSSLYWILSSVRRDERLLYMGSLKEEEPGVSVRVLGNGMVADLFRNVSNAVKRQYSTPKLDPTPCLPDPVSPDWNRYYQILALVLICWLLALFEPYGLRMRHTVMVTYHPDRARERAIWLYNRIISHRNSYVKIARREIRRKYKNAPDERVFRFRFLSRKTSMSCLLCNIKLIKGDDHVICPTEGCRGKFCSDCYSSLQYCSICTDPAKYGDLSDLSEEKDSSEDDLKVDRTDKKVCQATTKPTPPKKMSNIKINKPRFEKSLEGPERSQSDKLLQPEALLNQALSYCRKNISQWEGHKKLSDLESSDWNSDESENSVGSTTPRTQKCSTSQPNKKNENDEKKFPKFKTILRLQSSELFTGTQNRQQGCSRERKRQHFLPDFRFGSIEPSTTKTTTFIGIKSSIDIFKAKKSRAEGTTEKKTQKNELDSEEELIPDNKVTQTGSTNPTSKHVQFIMMKKDSNEFPSNSNSEEIFPEVPESSSSKTIWDENRENVRPTQDSARICTKLENSSDTSMDSYRLCPRDKSLSSDDPDNQELNDGIDLKRASGTLDFPHSRDAFDSHGTNSDSSGDVFLVEARKRSKSGKKLSKKSRKGVSKTSPGKSETEDKNESQNTKQGRLSWAPDLLSDLPSTKQDGSGTSSEKE